MRVVMLRHATRQREQDTDQDEWMEKSLPLSPSGETEAKARARDLAARGITPEAYFTSCFVHARQTAEILRDMVNSSQSADVVELCTLTPHYQGPRNFRGNWRGARMLGAIVQEVRFKGKDLQTLDTLVFVLHQPRLPQLLATMTSRDESGFSTFAYSAGMCVRADSISALLEGQGEAELLA